MYSNHRNNIAARQSDYMAVQQEVATGHRINKLSDDPLQSGRLMKIKSVERHLDQYTANLRSAKEYLGPSEQALDESQRLMNRAYTISIQGANATTDQTQRAALSREITTIKERLLTIANSKGSSGQYLFAGHKNDAQPYSTTGTILTYSGDANKILVETGPNETLQVNTLGGQNFVDAYAELDSLKSNLDSGNPGAISGVDLERLKARANTFATLRGEAGITMKRVIDLEDYNSRRKDELVTQGSEIEDVDIADAMIRLSQSQTAYQAALQTASIGFKLSLMDYLR